jgi:rhamnogalacturonan endolyase
MQSLQSQRYYNQNAIQKEKSGRGTVAVRISADSVFVSWRYLENDPENIVFDVFRNGQKITSHPVGQTTFLYDIYAEAGKAELVVKTSDGTIDGQMAVGHDGTGLYTTHMGHGDAMHLTQFFSNDKRLQVWSCHENKHDGTTLRDAATGEVITTELKNSSVNMGVWWDGYLSRELLDKNLIQKYDPETKQCYVFRTFEGAVSNNGTKATPAIQGDLINDWREEVLLRTPDNKSLRLFISTKPTFYRFHTFLHDPVYRISLATQNVAYNQPAQPGFFRGTWINKK